MYDVELHLCAYRVPQELALLFDQLVGAAPTEVRRTHVFRQVRELAAAELARSSERWTPYYDSGLREIAAIVPREIFASHRYRGPDHVHAVRLAFERHERICMQLDYAESIGARTLADAFRSLVVSPTTLTEWFGMCPAAAALDERIRSAALHYLDSIGEQRNVRALVDAERPARESFIHVPAAVIAAIGNPFDPLI